MKVIVEFGENAGRGDSDIHKTETLEVDNFRDCFRDLKRVFIEKWDLKEDADLDCLNELSEICEDMGEFYIGMDEGHYISGWRLI